MSGGDNWQAGDLALCVKAPTRPGHDGLTVPGRIYEVSGVWRDIANSLVLGFVGVAEKGDNFCGHLAFRFRKVTPPKADEFDREVIDLMLGKPAPVEA